jgi:cytochrome c oxidase assembly protein subunit 15
MDRRGDMEAVQQSERPAAQGAVLAVGFGTAVAMWAVGYVGRLPAVLLPSPLLLALLLGCLVGGGIVLGRYAAAGWRLGAAAGLLTGLVNLLVLGGLLARASAPGGVVPSALGWLPGSILLAVALTAAGAAAGARWLPRDRPRVDWNAAFVRVTIAAALLLLAVGGLVTSTGAGLAVVDWPRSFGYNMFLFPLSRMTGGIYYEHAHRLFGALVGLTTLVLALVLELREPRRWVRRLGWVAVGLVVVQGLLGGLRVTGTSLALALAHGVMGQLFVGLLVALGAFTSATWTADTEPRVRPGARTDHLLALGLLVLLLVQLLLGASERHFDRLVLVHVGVGITLVTPLALHVGVRSWALNAGLPVLQRLGLGLIVAILLQVLLGFGAFLLTASPETEGALGLAVATAHQWFGAVVLALAVLVSCFVFRLVTHDLRS